MEFTVNVKAVGDMKPPERHKEYWEKPEDNKLREELELAFALIAAAHGRSREAIIRRARVVIYGLRGPGE